MTFFYHCAYCTTALNALIWFIYAYLPITFQTVIMFVSFITATEYNNNWKS